MSPRPWYTSFFDDVYLRIFEPELGPARTSAEVDGVLALGGLAAGARVLDVACGQGRHAIELASRGFEVTGLDLSGVLLEHARRRADAAGVRVTWRESDMREPQGEAEFDAAINLYSSFGYLEDSAEDQRALDAVARALVPGGVVVQEIAHRDAEIRDLRPADVHELEDGLLLVERRTLDLRSSRMKVDYTLIEGDRVVLRRRHVLRLYSLPELEELHARAGLHVEAVYGGLDGGELELDDPAVVLVSRRGG